MGDKDMTDIIKLQIVGQFDHYDFTTLIDSKHKICFKNLNIIPKQIEEDFVFVEKAFIKQDDAIHLIGNLTYEEKIKFDAEIVLNEDNEYEIINPISVTKLKPYNYESI